jgi:hypothetical protein
MTTDVRRNGERGLAKVQRMRFVRVTVSHTQNRVVGVSTLDVPFNDEHHGAVRVFNEAAGVLVYEECEVIDLGVVEDEIDWRTVAGEPCSMAQYLLERLESGNHEVTKIHDCPCTLPGIVDRLRAKGLGGIPIKVRAWLANVLPEDRVAAIGIARGLPIAALRAAEALRNRRDPHGGSRMALPQSHGPATVQCASRGGALRARQQQRGAGMKIYHTKVADGHGGGHE